MKRIVVLGGGESGAGAAVLAQVKGFEVWLSDMGNIAPKYKELLDKYNIAWEEGHHTEEKILNADEIIKSPGIPLTAPLIVKAREAGIPIISEIEFAGRYTNAKMVCITGSNGKTTTTMLTYHILREAGLNVGLAGNVGNSLALQVAVAPHDYYVIELSSFQLDNMYEFKANIAVLLNITPDHLDRYDYKMENYTAAKFRIMQNLTSEDAFIYWQDDPIIAAQLEHIDSEARMMPFSALDEHEGCAAYIDNGIMKFTAGDQQWEIASDRLSLRGLHNMYNSMAAGLSASLLNINDEVIKRALSDFQAVEHRLEYVRTLRGVRYVNDSKATNVNSTWYALESMNEPVVLVLGGKDKGNDYTEIEKFVKDKVKAIVCLGVDNTKLHKFFDGMVPVVEDARSMQECVDKCASLAGEGNTVLLSPCCASFDLFKSYEDRGEQFKQCVNNLK
ncbi:MAG: UDP-N-acetylmuramoyl-L-alanine--D-glutamate ligase [Bacteroidales bacterium]|nr:UDP-N-acetylmuramoyl-L-alanine--D-glutamate ligase [Candidatus Sodaliphilus aphodohippi]